MSNILLQINSVINSGSTGRIAEEIGQTALANQWQSYIAFGRNDRLSQSCKIKIGNDWDVRWHGLQTRLFDRHGMASKNATIKMVKHIQKIKPNIVHLHNLHGYYLNIEILVDYLKKTDIPVVWTLHDCWPITGHCVYFDYIGCDRWKTQCYKCPQKTTYPSSYVIDRSVKNFSLKKNLFRSLPNLQLVPVSDWLAGILKESFLKDFPIKVIHNGINTNVFKPVCGESIRKKYSLDGKFILMGVASVWSPRKGLQDFIEINSRLDSDCQIILVGLSKEQISSMPRNIISIGKTENISQLAELYSTCDVFLNPTYEDNFPTTNIESLACGTPVITYKTGGSVEAIDKTTGLTVDKGDIEGLTNAIQEIKEKGKNFYTIACERRARIHYRKEDRYQEYMNLYNMLLSKQGSYQ